jgi:2-polyprenyl-3-methyl-5-hydroxy-6-metoxy-1,4-benzoquinol methylase
MVQIRTGIEMNISDIRPKNYDEQRLLAYESDVQRYRNQVSDFHLRDCPGCGSENSDFFASVDGFDFNRCDACFTIYMNPGPTPAMVDEFYRNSANYEYWSKIIYPKTRNSRRSTLHQSRALFVISEIRKYFDPSQTLNVLEIGAGTGDSLSVLRENCSQSIKAFAVEPNPSMLEALSENDVNVLEDISSLQNEIDIVLGFEVLEHFLNPSEFFKICKDVLKPNGIVAISTPNAHSLEVLQLKEMSTTLDIEHISVLTPAAMHSLADRNQFKVQSITTPGSFDVELIETEEGTIQLEVGDKKIPHGFLQTKIQDFRISSNMRVVFTNK